MASESFESPEMELFGSDVFTPKPLRISKYSESVPSNDNSRDYPDGCLSVNSESSSRAPRYYTQRSLMIPKTRRSRISTPDVEPENFPSCLYSASIDSYCSSTTNASGRYPVMDSVTDEDLSGQDVDQESSQARFPNGIPHSSTTNTMQIHRGLGHASRHSSLSSIDQAEYRCSSSRQSLSKSRTFVQRALSRVTSLRFKSTECHPPHTAYQMQSPIQELGERHHGSTFNSYPLEFSSVLFPVVDVLPQTASFTLEDGESLWAAVLVTGTLFSGSGEVQNTYNYEKYGQLCDLEIKAFAGSNWTVTEVIEPVARSSSLHAGRSTMALVQVRYLPGVMTTHSRDSSFELFDELENHLGEGKSEYLRVQLSYRHSFHPQRRGGAAKTGICYQSSTSIIDVSATIGTTASDPSWGPHNDKIKNKDSTNSLAALIFSHFDKQEADTIMSRMKCNNLRAPSIELGHKITSRELLRSTDSPSQASSQSDVNMMHPSIWPRASTLTLALSSGPPDPSNSSPQYHKSTDPARKIWADMRRISSGGSRKSIRRGNLENSFEDSRLDDDEPSVNPHNDWLTNDQLQVKQLALRNKRSIGADTLHSIARNGGAMGLGTVKFFGFGAPWW